MLEYWSNYVDVFRKLIAAGFIIVKRKGSCLYWWVYPHSSVPAKLKIKEAYEILSYSDRSLDLFGSTHKYVYPFRVSRQLSGGQN